MVVKVKVEVGRSREVEREVDKRSGNGGCMSVCVRKMGNESEGGRGKGIKE